MWTFATFGTVRIDMVYARHLEKQLVSEILSLPPNRPRWCKSILDRFENARRSSAQVCQRELCEQ